jgi:hypothetical protein
VVVSAVALVWLAAPVRADPGGTVFPGMQIQQGNTVCMVGFVEPRLRLALTSGRCDPGAVVTDRGHKPLGAVLIARQTFVDEETDRDTLPVAYEVVVLAPGVIATDRLPTGRHLRDASALRLHQGLPVCQFQRPVGQRCGAAGSVFNGHFAIPDVAVDDRDFGGPVYVLDDGDGAIMVGMFEGLQGSAPEAESWQAVMWQLYLDLHSIIPREQARAVQLVGSVRRS